MISTLTAFSNSPSQTVSFGKSLAEILRDGDVVGLEGDLGVGKTALVKGAAARMGYLGRVTSPTFTLVNEYDVSADWISERVIRHIDAYRLNSADEAFEIGLDELLDEPVVCFVEWSDRLSAEMTDQHLVLGISSTGESSRRVTIRWGQRWAARVDALEVLVRQYALSDRGIV